MHKDLVYWIVRRFTINLLLFTLFLPCTSQENCTKITTKDGVEVYSCDPKGSKYRGVYVVFEASATLEQYRQIAINVLQFDQWHFRTSDQRIIEVMNDTSIIFYSKVDAPWPLSDRDLVQHLNIYYTNQGIDVIITSRPKLLPENNGLIRIPKSNSQMKVRTKPGGILRFTYYVEVDPGGEVPPWIINLFSIQGPLHTFSALKRILEGTSTS